MSEGSRGTQAPSRPDESTDGAHIEGSPTNGAAVNGVSTDGTGANSPGSNVAGSNGASSNGAGQNGDDFYATVNNAAATRSTRIKHGDGSGVDETDGDAAPAAGSGAVAGADDQGQGVGKSWRERWASLSSSMTGKAKSTEPAPGGTAEAGSPASPVVAARAQPVEPPVQERADDSQTRQIAPVAVPVSPPVPAPAASAVAVSAATAAGSSAVAARAAEQSQPARAAKPKIGAAHRTRKARLRLSRIDPWSVMKTSFLFSIAAGIVLVVAVYVIWTVVGSSGLFSSINDIVSSVVSTPGDTTPFRIEEYVNTQKVMGVTAFVACIDVVIFTALATLLSFLYNLAATMLGGLEVTLAED